MNRIIRLGAVLLFFTACGSNPTRGSVPRQVVAAPESESPTGVARQEMFLILTSHTWCNALRPAGDDSAPPRVLHESELTLMRNGTYGLIELDDTVEPREPGGWNFKETGPSAGMLYLADSNGKTRRTVLFEITAAGRLEAHGLRETTDVDLYVPCGPVAEATITWADALPSVRMEDAVMKLGGTKWSLVSDVASPAPTEIEFLPDGRVHLTLETSHCGNRASWRYGRPLNTLPDGRCREEMPYRSSRVRQTGKFVVMGVAPYLPAENLPVERFMLLYFLPGRLEGVVAYTPPLRSTPLNAKIELWNDGGSAVGLGDLVITQYAFTASGRQERPVARVAINGVLQPDESFSTEAALRLAPLDEEPWSRVHLAFELDVTGRRDPALVSHHY